MKPIALLLCAVLVGQAEYLRPGKDGVVIAPASSCEFAAKPGILARKEKRANRIVIGNWTRAIDVPYWKVSLPRDGRYAVQMSYAAGKESAGVVYTVTLKGMTVGMVKGVVEPTGGVFKMLPVGDTELEAGDYVLLVQPENKVGQPAMALEKILIRRIGD